MKKIKKIKDGLISRQIGVAKLALKTGKSLYESREFDLQNKLKKSFGPHIDQIVNELGVMKGPLMKGGQLLATMGASFLPQEAIDILKSLENKTNYLAWSEIKKQIPVEFINELEIEEEAMAAASLGQVHLAKYQNKKYALKIQYKGVKRAIKNDMRVLKMLMKVLNIIPKSIDLSEIYNEIEQMLHDETNYLKEAESTKKFKTLLSPYSYFKIPDIFDRFSNDKILCSEFLDGHGLHDLDELNLGQDERNILGREFMRLLFLEIFHFDQVQTDVHMGNYIILPDLKWGLIDFGACKSPPSEFMDGYRKLLIACAYQNKQSFFETLYEMGYLSKVEETNEEFFWEYACIIGAPFQESSYDWGQSNIAQNVFDYAPRLIKEVKIGNPPRHSLFLDRKIAGVYFVLQKLECSFDVKGLLEDTLNKKL